MAATYEFTGGYPTPETIRKAYDDADYCRAGRAVRVLPNLRSIGARF
jgi:hypothetical protein